MKKIETVKSIADSVHENYLVTVSSEKRAMPKSQSSYLNQAYQDILEDGFYEAVLVAKAWGRAACLHCYFDIPKLSKRVRLTCWKDHGVNDRKYKCVKGNMDFATPGTEGKTYLIEVKLGKTGWMRFMSAEICFNKT